MIVELIDRINSYLRSLWGIAYLRMLLPDPAAKPEEKLIAMDIKKERGAHDCHGSIVETHSSSILRTCFLA